MRSGIERLVYALMIIVVATVTAWILALALNLKPEEFVALSLPAWPSVCSAAAGQLLRGLRVLHHVQQPAAHGGDGGLIGAVANTLRLELVDLTALPPSAAAFLGSLAAGLIASLLTKKLGYPRISITVPSIVIMVPGLYLYRGVYNLGEMSLTPSASWLASALLIILALPLGLIFARIITDRSFRHCT